jgi:hypothetical protein
MTESIRQLKTRPLTDLEKHQILRYRIQEINLVKTWCLFERSGIEPILIKGWAASRLYPKPYSRNPGDIDLAVSPERYEEALQFTKDVLAEVDLHNGLRHLDTVSWDDLFRNSRIVRCDSANIRILRPEDHLRVLCTHWLTDGGAYREKLLDIYYAVENRPPDFDWERCLGIVSEQRREWVIKTIGLAKKYCGLDISDLQFAEEAENLPRWLIRTVEKEWASEVRLLPLHHFLKDPRGLLVQLKKRLPPNPIQATIEMEGRLDEGPRFKFQVRNMFARLKPSLKRVYAAWRKLSKSTSSSSPAGRLF